MDIFRDVSLAKRTTLRLGGTALAEAVVREATDAEELALALDELGGEPLAFGAGSNILARDGDLGIVLVSSRVATGPMIVGEAEGGKIVRVGTGLKLPSFLNWLASQGLSGLARLRGIPGSVGGAVAMNAGSWGQSFCDRLARLLVYSRERGLRWIEAHQWEAGYRRFAPEGESGFFLALEAELVLDAADPGAIRAEMAEYFARKKAVQPLAAATCGCVFKNPAGESAGRLLDKVGFRGRSVGGMALSEMHANFLVNTGGGTAEQALELIALAGAAVRERFGIELELEVKVVG
ncbi:UDP-N-acetylenolpyruvoylglucosamine reductase [Alkalidesulfovibrio alkalitolerans DSM 16529]|jgi:UDP-N-acetylmuramate dehydrogenase|uniref:UDP-N-acetylenolpyruvoylglucosamine reductase n=1 Tax=Alkalidesulfovibrio alkalitolerans DSM 16529 TaxID=1121439 RepID=S7US49_9BACT|nr:UDP-N-acetylmuramate dehydrogenase [Alkalidesulfovibrio alkalitolerans]EPR35128.1 UDP-N-acetylenolpyruvoylglucosamine reductase [Alkalidesulfovibrio alkalitolerans DSM 16529]